MDRKPGYEQYQPEYSLPRERPLRSYATDIFNLPSRLVQRIPGVLSKKIGAISETRASFWEVLIPRFDVRIVKTAQILPGHWTPNQGGESTAD
jgi:hypothetical protein